MKKLLWLLVLMVAFSACAEEADPVFETVADAIVPAAVEAKPIFVWMPNEAAAQTMAAEGECYTWGQCELRVQTLDGGDIRRTMEALTGQKAEKLTVMEYERQGLQMYQTVWSMTGEEGITLGRAMVADDGHYHYCISLLSPEGVDTAEDYAQICASFSLTGEDAVK